MEIEQLRGYENCSKDEYAIRLAQGRTLSHVVRNTDYTSFKENKMTLAEKMKAKAAALKSGKNSVSKPEPKEKKSAKKQGKGAKVKQSNREPRVQIKDKKGKLVTGRDNTFVCTECGNSITGPWSYKTHLVKQHGFSRKKAGLREEK